MPVHIWCGLGLLALLLGFTFSMSMQRFDNRSMALIDEANAIGTATLRIQLLPEQYQADADPRPVLILLFLVFISSGGIMGYSAGLTGERMFAPIVLVSLLITMIVFLIIDLDRPKRGLIQVDQSVMVELRQSLDSRS